MVTTTYGYGEMVTGKPECLTVVLTMICIILRELRKVRVEVETVYVSDNPSVMVGQYLRGNLNVHIIIDDFL